MIEIPIRNKSNATLRVMLEPWAQTYDVEPGDEISILGDFGESQLPEFDYFSENFIAVWSPPKTKVTSNGVVLSPLKEE